MDNFISSTQNKLIKQVKKILKGDKTYFVIEGKNIIVEAINNNVEIKYIFELNNSNIFKNSIKITENVLKAITSTKSPEGYVALCEKNLNNTIGTNIVFCDNVQDPGNIGTIIRSAVAFGYDTIFTNVNVYNPKIIRSSQGALFKINIIEYDDPIIQIKNLALDNKIYITTLDKDSKIYNKVLYPGLNKVIVFGNEGHGVNKKIYSFASEKIHIPIKFESLNVAVAAGIILNNTYNGDKNE
ncbi:RNA methyltransferase [Mycoplasmopsis phocirhinis]|uniref:RNA methyltransferase n=1 Tax=Mycoplasmopsis phocirhinis TaxID=142650 RepID=A0A4P6MRV5_9BACT|nr:RNA methyltransferase [Mycoplasmopsis phocirhinis]QBF34799.1 RNA methyltransferase [Mycoplasmopsis phocirhinis]